LVEDVFRGHQLGEAGRKDQLVGITLEQHGAVLGIDQNGVRRTNIWLVFFLRVLFLDLMRRSGRAFMRGTRRVGRRRDGDSAKAARKEGYYCPTSKGKISQTHHQPSFTAGASGDCSAIRRSCGGKMRLSKGHDRPGSQPGHHSASGRWPKPAKRPARYRRLTRAHERSAAEWRLQTRWSRPLLQ